MSDYRRYDQDKIADMYDHAEQLLLKGFAENNVIGTLTSKGIDTATATEIVRDLQGSQTNRPKYRRRKVDPVARQLAIDLMIRGLILAGASVVLTYVIFLLFPRSVLFLVAFLPAVLGMMQFSNGLMSLFTGTRPFSRGRFRRR